jgi:hypothetical protein
MMQSPPRRNRVVINMSVYQKLKNKIRLRKSLDEIPKQRISELSMAKNHSMNSIFTPRVTSIINNVNRLYDDGIKLVDNINTSKNISSEYYDKFLLPKYEKNETHAIRPQSPKIVPFNLPDISPIKKHKRQSTLSHIKLSPSIKKSLTNKEKDEIKERLNTNKNQTGVINKYMKNIEKSKVSDKLELNGLTLAFQKELPGYVRKKRLENKSRYDYLSQLNSGLVLKDVVDNLYMPGCLIKEENRITSYQPKYVKKKFRRLKMEASEALQKNISKIIK